MKQIILSMILILCVNQCLSQNGFPKQFQATLNITGMSRLDAGLRRLLYDYENLRARFDVQGWRAQQNETYMIQYKPKGAEPDTVSRK